MKFNEWLSQRNDCEELATSENLGLETTEDDQLIENQLEQWVIRLAGLLQNVSSDKKEHFLSKVIKNIQEIS